ncbi:hypothetical protein ATKI12_4660 [Kitasatospora sp. Ki12]
MPERVSWVTAVLGRRGSPAGRRGPHRVGPSPALVVPA